VLAPEGETFEYVERRKTAEGDRRGDHVRETHTLTTYPASLQKKVILLKHFRNYLVEQNKREEETAETPPPPVEAFVTPANDDDNSLVYLKKWVRTRHAILFRLSNRTVQVVFFDHTEVLLSAEARSVTYVDKNRQRSTHSLAAVMSEPRADIAKRLKYTKDILHQLITGAKR
jgi:polo-like kinase 1